MSDSRVEEIQARLEKLEAETATRFDNLEKLLQEAIKTQVDNKNYCNSSIVQSENQSGCSVTAATTPPTTPSPLEFASQSKLSRQSKLPYHDDNSMTSIGEIFSQLSKAADVMSHSLNFMRNHVGYLQPSIHPAAYEASAYYRPQKRKISVLQSSENELSSGQQMGGPTHTPLNFPPNSERKDSLMSRKKSRQDGTTSSTSSRYCGVCGLKGHNARTCKRDVGEARAD